jgi:hypothetical protein
VANTVQIRTLDRAIRIVGHETVARVLRSAPDSLTAWLSGHATMPDRMFLRLVDLLEEVEHPPGPK